MHKEKILVIDDEVEICNLLNKFLTQNEFDVTSAYSGARAISLLNKDYFDLVLTDFRLEDTDGMAILEKIKEKSPETQVIMMTGYSDVKLAIQAIKKGAYDYISKPLFPDEILSTITKALGNSNNTEERQRISQLKNNSQSNGNHLVGQSKVMKDVYRQISLVAPTTYSIIIFGESGTGKESAARALHDLSNRRNRPFVALDCGALSTELAGSELFGHEKGAFTGAIGIKQGLFEIADGGTLFLDEIGNLSFDVQTTLLRALQERKVRRLGGNKEKAVDIRLVVASNENLFRKVQQGSFREDLYYRINEFSINLPPLREREQDILVLAQHFLLETAKELNKNIKGFSEEVIRTLITYSWPGNVRELKNVVRRAVLLTEGETVKPDALPLEISGKKYFVQESELITEAENRNDIFPALKKSAMEAEQETILNTLRKVNFNKSKAARLLQIDRKTLYNKIKALNLEL